MIFHLHAASKLPDSSWDCDQKCKNICREVLLVEHLTGSRKCKLSHGTAYYQNIPSPAPQRQADLCVAQIKRTIEDSSSDASLWDASGQKCPSSVPALAYWCITVWPCKVSLNPCQPHLNTTTKQILIMITWKHISFKMLSIWEKSHNYYPVIYRRYVLRIANAKDCHVYFLRPSA